MPIPEKYLGILKANAKNARVPNEKSLVEKDECIFSFDNQYSPNGLYTNISTWQSYGHDYVKLDSERTNQQIYLHQKFYKRVIPSNNNDDKQQQQISEEKVTKLGIGIDGGFEIDDKKINVEKNYSIIIIPDFYKIEDLNDKDIPIMITECIKGIINHAGIKAHEEVQSWADELRETICHHNLIQIEANEKTKPSSNPKDWKCMFCGAKENLWFNLSDGFIGCGRQQFDGTGVLKACGASLQHYQDTGKKYPLVVKLGTITPNGGDVYSYHEKEDDMVINPFLNKHLSHWGIDIMKLEKTDKTMQEMNIDFNKNFDWSLIMEKGKNLKFVSDKELIGLDNLGNTCYMNSTLQVLFAMDEVKSKYYKHAEELIKNAPQDAANDFATQIAKLSVGLLSDKYLKQQKIIDEENQQWLKKQQQNNNNNNNNNIKEQKDEKDNKNNDNDETRVAIKPRMFKRLIGKGHADFSTNKQQDAAEYFRYLLEYINRQERGDKRINKDIPNLKDLFKITFEEKLQCQTTKQVKYSQSEDITLTLLVNLDDAVDKKIVQQYQERQQKREKLEAEKEKLKKQQEEQQEKGKQQANQIQHNNIDVVNKEKKDEKKGEKKDEEEEKIVLPEIPLEKCLSRYIGEEMIDDWISPATGKKGKAIKSKGLKNMPKYLMLEISRYYYNSQWIPTKHEVIVNVPEKLSLEHMRSYGIQPNEVELPKDKNNNNDNANKQIQPDSNIVNGLLDFGMATENGCKRAALAVKNESLEKAAQWLMDHIGDENLNDPLPEEKPKNNNNNNNNVKFDPEQVAILASMGGFTNEQVEMALRKTNGDATRAADFLFSHIDELEQLVVEEQIQSLENVKDSSNNNNNNKENLKSNDGKGEYELFGIISHLGNATSHGHYVAHVKKNGVWYFFNDDKVAISEEPPFGAGYLYAFVRKN